MLVNITNVKFRIYSNRSLELLAVTDSAEDLQPFLLKRATDFVVMTDEATYNEAEFYMMYNDYLDKVTPKNTELCLYLGYEGYGEYLDKKDKKDTRND